MKKTWLRYSVKGLLKTFSPALFVILLIGGYYGIENYSGAKRWIEAKDRLEAEGVITERLKFRNEMPPDEENFAAHPLISSCYLFSDDSSGTITYDHPDQHFLFTALKLGAVAKDPVRNWTNGTPSNYDQLIGSIMGRGGLTMPSEGSDAAKFLGAFAPFADEIGALEEAAKRPHAQMPFSMPEENPYSSVTPYFNDFKAHIGFQKARAVALLDENRIDDAMGPLRVMMQFARTSGSYPTYIGTLVEIAMQKMCFDVIMMGIEDRKWTEVHLIEIQKALSRITIIDHAFRGLNGELLTIISFANYIKAYPGRLSLIQSFGNADLTWKIAPVLPSGIWDHNKAYACETMFLYLEVLRSSEFNDVRPTLMTGQHSPRRILTDIVMPANGGIVKSVFEAETLRDLTRLSCAIERYRLNTGKHPDNLESLVPQFISSIPQDRFDRAGSDIKYLPDNEGEKYIIYSVGINGIDDLGTTAVKGHHRRRDMHHGDLSWGIPGPWPARP